MKHFVCAWINGSGNQKTSNVMDHAILSIVIANIINDCIWLYEYCRFNKYSEISVTGQCQINIYLPDHDPEQDYRLMHAVFFSLSSWFYSGMIRDHQLLISQDCIIKNLILQFIIEYVNNLTTAWNNVCVCACVCVCVCMCVCMCVSTPRLLITSGMMWHDIWTPYDWLNKFYSCYMATVVTIINGRTLGIGMCRTH